MRYAHLIQDAGAEARLICLLVAPYAGAARRDWMALGLKRLDVLIRIERNRPLWPTVEAPVALISTGADREETIVLKHPFE